MVRFNALTELTTPATADTFAIEDTDANVTKYITYANILTDIGSASLTLTNKTIDADNNTISNLAIGAEVTGASTSLTDTASIAYLATLALTTNGNGASLIGIEDAGTIITATTVEGALAENRTAINLNTSKTGVTTQISNVVEDTTPQLGGNLDIQAFNIETAVAADFVKLAALTATATELNYVDGVTSAIQTQIDAKAPIADPTFTGEIGIGAVNVSETELGILEGATLSTTELNYVDGVTSAIQTQLDAKLANVVEDTTPQLGADLDRNNFAMTTVETAGEILANGDLAYLKSDGKYWKADASAAATATTDLLMCTEAISADATGTFVELGQYTTTGLTAGSNYYVSETAGAITATAPTTSAAIVRIVGTALSTTELKFKPDFSWVELS